MCRAQVNGLSSLVPNHARVNLTVGSGDRNALVTPRQREARIHNRFEQIAACANASDRREVGPNVATFAPHLMAGRAGGLLAEKDLASTGRVAFVQLGHQFRQMCLLVATRGFDPLPQRFGCLLRAFGKAFEIFAQLAGRNRRDRGRCVQRPDKLFAKPCVAPLGKCLEQGRQLKRTGRSDQPCEALALRTVEPGFAQCLGGSHSLQSSRLRVLERSYQEIERLGWQGPTVCRGRQSRHAQGRRFTCIAADLNQSRVILRNQPDRLDRCHGLGPHSRRVVLQRVPQRGGQLFGLHFGPATAHSREQ